MTTESKTTTVYGAHAATTGNRAHAATTGFWAHATTTGYGSNASTTGKRAHAATTGFMSHASTTGNGAVAASLGAYSAARAGVDGAIVLVCRNDDGQILHIRASKVGENGIKPDTWYSLNESGDFEEKEV